MAQLFRENDFQDLNDSIFVSGECSFSKHKLSNQWGKFKSIVNHVATPTQMFSFFKNTYFEEHLRTADSVNFLSDFFIEVYKQLLTYDLIKS